MSFFFLNKWIWLLIVLLLALSITFLPTIITLIITSIIVITLFFIRRKSFKSSSQEYLTDNIFFLPVSGKIKKIEILDDRTKSVLISTPFFSPWGIYAPSNCKVSNIGFSEFEEGNSTDENHQILQGQDFEFINLKTSEIEIEMKFLGRKKLNELVLNVDLGDQCSLGSNLGIFPWGGKLLLNISGDVKLNIKEGMKVHALDTFLCKAN